MLIFWRVGIKPVPTKPSVCQYWWPSVNSVRFMYDRENVLTTLHCGFIDLQWLSRGRVTWMCEGTNVVERAGRGSWHGGKNDWGGRRHGSIKLVKRHYEPVGYIQVSTLHSCCVLSSRDWLQQKWNSLMRSSVMEYFLIIFQCRNLSILVSVMYCFAAFWLSMFR